MGPEQEEQRADSVADLAFTKAERLARVREAESRQALALIAGFVKDARASGVAPTRLRARSYGGDARYRSNIEGWYIRKDRSVGVGTDGRFYVLSTPTSLSARVTGVILKPSDPPMELGRGARDGESIPLPDALKKRLDAGNTYP